ncbi:MAG: hypothetical protein FWE62_04825 [Firmicutes bacterium]|nr:hypothetical protein [Bacillota bacterium]
MRFFIHPRAGSYHQTYGSREWFETVAFIAAEAEAYGLKAWLYDEDPFPSGAAGGRVFFENPEFAARKLVIYKIPCDETGLAQYDLGACKVLSAFAVKRAVDGRAADKIDVSESVGTVRRHYFQFMHKSAYFADLKHLTYLHPRAETFLPEMQLKVQLPDADYVVYAAVAETAMDSDKYGTLPDIINDKCTDLFIALTHEKYKKHIGKYFGGCVPGIFFDECKAGGIIPWTGDIEDVFFSMHGYTLRDKYYHMAETFDETSRQVRQDYLSAVNHLINTRFYEKIAKWCKKNDMILTGHILSEEDPVYQTMLGDNVYNSVKYCDIPGFDIIGNYLGDRDHFALAVGAKTVSSAAHQQNKEVVMCEAFGCNPFNFGMDALVRKSNWLFALGITWLVPHGFYYSYDGMRKLDAGTSFFFQHKEFKRFGEFSAYAERTGKKLAESKHLCNTCLLNPTRDFMRLVHGERENAEKLRSQFYFTARSLTENHIEWDIVDYDKLYGSKIENGKLKVGRESYENVVLLRNAVCAELSCEAAEYLEEHGLNVIFAAEDGSADYVALKNRAVHSEITGLGGDSGNLIAYRKKARSGEFNFIFNNSPDAVLFALPEAGNVRVMEPWTGEYYRPEVSGGKMRIYLRGYDAVFVDYSAQKAKSDKVFPYEYIAETRQYKNIAEPEWDYIPPDCDVLANVTKWDVIVTHNGAVKKYDGRRYGQIRNYHGTDLDYLKNRKIRPYPDKAEEYAHYPVRAEYTALVSGLPGKGRPLLLTEGSTLLGDCQIFINGTELARDAFFPHRVYDFTNRAADLSGYVKDGKIEIKITYASAREFDGINSAIYIIGRSERVF